MEDKAEQPEQPEDKMINFTIELVRTSIERGAIDKISEEDIEEIARRVNEEIFNNSKTP